MQLSLKMEKTEQTAEMQAEAHCCTVLISAAGGSKSQCTWEYGNLKYLITVKTCTDTQAFDRA